jgi:hypothetical protein
MLARVRLDEKLAALSAPARAIRDLPDAVP